MKIGFIGLGMMGRPMAERLLASGFDVQVHDSNAALAADFGGRWRDSPAGAADGADILVTMLPNGDIVRTVLLAAGEALKPGAVVIDTSSSDAGGTVGLGRELGARNVRLVDAPVSGGVPMARDGKLTLMVGGADDDLFAAVEPLLSALGARIVRLGPLGAGHAAKAINNCIAAAVLAVTAEGLVMGEKFGIAPETLLDVINSSTGRSAVSESVFRTQILPRSYAQGFALALMAKDVDLADRLRQRLGLDLPMVAETQRLWSAARDAMPGADFTAYHAIVAEAAKD